MLLATWNVNSVLARLPQVMRWLDSVQPDVVCMQETKCTDDKFPTLLFQERGYHCQLFGQQSYNGVATNHDKRQRHRYRQRLHSERAGGWLGEVCVQARVDGAAARFLREPLR